MFECFFLHVFVCLEGFSEHLYCMLGIFLICLNIWLFFSQTFVCLAVFQYSRLSAASVLRRLKGEARVTSAGQRQPLLNQPDMRIVPFHFCFCFSIFLSAFVTSAGQPRPLLNQPELCQL